MGSLRQFDVIYAIVPFHEHDGRKAAHPAVVLDATTVMPLVSETTSQVDKAIQPTDLHLEDWHEAGLDKDSTVKLRQQENISQDDVLKILGHLTRKDINRVISKLKEIENSMKFKVEKPMNESFDLTAPDAYDYIQNEMSDSDRCCICGEPIEGYGNNAAPVCDGRCCDKCNWEKVIPARIKEYKAKNEFVDESLNESASDEDAIATANEIVKYVDDSGFNTNVEIGHCEVGPLGILKCSFEFDGDWKHEHLYFNSLVEDWARDNGKYVYKITETITNDTGSDWYGAIHSVYIAPNEKTFDMVNRISDSGMFDEVEN